MYLSASERTGVLLEVIEDAEKVVNAAVEAETTQEEKAYILGSVLALIIMNAKRHPEWPETAKKRQEEFEKKRVEEETRRVEAQQVVRGPDALTSDDTKPSDVEIPL